MEDKKFIEKYYLENLNLTKKRIRESVSDDNMIIQCANNIDEIEKAANLLAKRLREWYELKNPEFSRSVSGHERFIELILGNKDKKDNDSMGAELDSIDYQPVMDLAKAIDSLYRLKDKHEKYLDKKMQRLCPNMTTVAGSMIGARLLSHAGSIKRLSLMTASRIQLLGAEKALFRHMKTGAKAPKHGLILNHPLLQNVGKDDRGKAARALSDKIAIAAKVDYFRGEFIGSKLRDELVKRFGIF